MILDILILGLAVFGLTEVVKLFLPFGLLSQVKGLVVVGLSAVGAVALASTVREGLLLFGATLGAAILIHSGNKALDGVGEINRLQAMLQLAKKMHI